MSSAGPVVAVAPTFSRCGSPLLLLLTRSPANSIHPAHVLKHTLACPPQPIPHARSSRVARSPPRSPFHPRLPLHRPQLAMAPRQRQSRTTTSSTALALAAFVALVAAPAASGLTLDLVANSTAVASTLNSTQFDYIVVGGGNGAYTPTHSLWRELGRELTLAFGRGVQQPVWRSPRASRARTTSLSSRRVPTSRGTRA